MSRSMRIKVPLPSTILLFLALLMVVAFPDVRGVRAVMFVTLAGYLLSMIIVNRSPIRWFHVLWLGGFYALSIISRRWSIYPGGAETVIGNIFYAMILNWSLAEYVYQGKRSTAHMSSVMMAVAVLLTLNFAMNWTVEDGRFSVGINENSMGMNAAYLFGMMLYGAKEANWKKWYLNAMLFAVALIALLSGSRKALLMLILFGIAYLFFWRPGKIRITRQFVMKILATLAVCAVAVILLMKVDVFYNAIGNRLESLFLQWFMGEEADGSAISRGRMVTIGMNMFSKMPWLGAGHNAFKLASGYWTYSHNNYVEILCSLGVVGFAVYYGPMLYFTVEAIRLWRRGIPGAILPMTIFLIQIINDFSQVSYYSVYNHVFLGIAVGYVYLMKQEYRQGKYNGVIIRRGRRKKRGG